MNKTKQTIIQEVTSIKTGMTAGRKWELFKVTDEDGWEYTTFSKDYENLIGEPTELTYEETETKGRDGRTFLNRRLVEPKKIEKETKREYDAGEKMADLLAEILLEVKAIRQKGEYKKPMNSDVA